MGGAVQNNRYHGTVGFFVFKNKLYKKGEIVIIIVDNCHPGVKI